MINIDDRILTEVTPDQFWLLNHIAKRLNAQRVCWPSNKTLCDDTGFSLNHLQKIKKELVELKFIQVIKRSMNGGPSSNFYKIRTKYISIFTITNLSEMDELSDTPPAHSLGIPYPQETTPPYTHGVGNEVLTIEVLTKEQKPSSLDQKINTMSDDVITDLNNIKLHYVIRGKVEATTARLKLIKARIKESKIKDGTQIRKMIEHKAKEWKGTQFEKYLRIETLFQASKFQTYMDESAGAPEEDWTEKRRNYNPTTTADQSGRKQTDMVW